LQKHKEAKETSENMFPIGRKTTNDSNDGKRVFVELSEVLHGLDTQGVEILQYHHDCDESHNINERDISYLFL
jgi:hypothetical protein